MCLPWTMKLKRKLIETILAFNRLIASGEFLTYCDHSQEIARISASPYVIWRIYKGKLKGLKCRWGWSLLKLSGAANNQYSCFKERSLGGLFYFFCSPLVLTNGSPVHEYEYNNKPVLVKVLFQITPELACSNLAIHCFWCSWAKRSNAWRSIQ